jgi:hypothetical protein
MAEDYLEVYQELAHPVRRLRAVNG